MRICIHRGTHEIGGSCVEIESQGKRIVLDVGLPLNSDLEDVPLPKVSGFEKTDPSLLGIIISHPHLDHYGLSPKLPRSLNVLIGPAAVNILKASKLFVPHGVEFEKIIPLKDGAQIQFGPFGVTPYLVDHSAYDAYAILVEADGKRLFYTGDFRSHGRKGKLFEKLLSHPPRNVDVLLMEGSTLGRTGIDNEYPKETDLEGKFLQTFKSAEGMAMVWCSGQNIDRLVTVYRAARRSGRQLIADMYTASVLRAVGNQRLPQPGWVGFRVFLPWNQKRTIIDKKLFEFSQSFSDYRIYPEQLEHDAGKSVILFRPSMRIDLEKANCLQNSVLIYSLWSGYLEQYKPFLNWLKSKSIPMLYCHTSGHASLLDLKEFARAINAKMLVPIHTFQPEEFSNHFKNVVQKEDGEWWEPELQKS